MEKPEKRRGGVTGKGFMPGRSGNPGGRPKGLAEQIRRATRDGQTIIAFMTAIASGKKMNGRKPRLCDRMEAHKWLADRGWGKPMQSIEHGGIDTSPSESNVVIYIPDNRRDQRPTTKESGEAGSGD